MTLPANLWQQVRVRANFACEYCGITEADAGGELTVDHFRPVSFKGTDDLSNLLYCCFRCNVHKRDYWPVHGTEEMLWNPRAEPAGLHFPCRADGAIHPITTTGAVTLRRLQLNRPALVAHRLRRFSRQEESRLLIQLGESLNGLRQMQNQLESLLKHYDALLEAHRTLFDLLIRKL